MGNPYFSTLKEYILKIYEATGCSARLGLGDIGYGANQVMCLTVDTEHAKAIQDSFTSFEDGIRKTVEYLMNKSI